MMRYICGYALLLVFIVQIKSFPPDGPPPPKKFPIQQIIQSNYPYLIRPIYVHIRTVQEQPVWNGTQTRESPFVHYADLNEVKFYVIIFLEYNSTKFKVPVMVESGAATLITPYFVITANQTTPLFKFYPAYKYTALAQPYDLDYTYTHDNVTDNLNYRWLRWRVQSIRGFHSLSYALLQAEFPFTMDTPYREFDVLNWESLAYTRQRLNLTYMYIKKFKFTTFYRVPAVEPDLEQIYKFSPKMKFIEKNLTYLSHFMQFRNAYSNRSHKLCNKMLGSPLLARGNLVGVLAGIDPMPFDKGTASKPCDGTLVYLTFFLEQYYKMTEFLIDWEARQKMFDEIDNVTILYDEVIQKILKSLDDIYPNWNNITKPWQIEEPKPQSTTDTAIRIRAHWHPILFNFFLTLIMRDFD